MSALYHGCELMLPEIFDDCPGFQVGNSLIKSFVFSTDIAVIRNCDAHAVLCVYPFACNEEINRSIIKGSGRPVFNGVAGAITSGERCVKLALSAQKDGAAAVVANMMTTPDNIAALSRAVDIPVVLTVATVDDEVRARIAAGASILNVAAGHKTSKVVASLRQEFPQIPLMATGGKTLDTMKRTLEAGAQALVWTPPNIQEIERQVMLGHRIRANA